MSTKNAADWLAERGFKPGIGGPGTITVGWYDHGPNPNDGHMAMTLSDGSPAESGGSHGDFLVGAGAAGADSPQFDQHMFLPTLFGEGPPGAAGSSSSAYSGGGGTPGVGPNGEAGTYSVDQGAVRDAQARVAEADARVKETEAKQRELEADAKESDKIRAQADVDKAKADADKARRELGEAQQGKFTPGKAAGGKGGAAGGGELGEIGSIAGSFLKETLGIGSWLPDLTNLLPVQIADTLIGTALPMLSAYQSGEWQPGGLLGDALGTSGGTSSAPFGMPDATAPPMPAPGVHAGAGGLPGPAGPTVDASVNINGNVGWDRADVDKKRNEALYRAIPRIPV